MSSIRTILEPVLIDARDDLAEVGAILERTALEEIDGAVAGMDLKLRGLYQRLEAARKLLTLYRTPQPKNYNPARVLREAAGQVGVLPEETGLLRAVRVCVGDAEQVVECLRIITGALQEVRTTVRPGEQPPDVLVELRERVPNLLSIDGLVDITWEDLEERWRAATHGGALRLEEYRVVLMLEGTEEPPASIPGLEAPLKAMKQAVQRLRSWRGAIGHYEPGYASAAEIVEMYRGTVDKSIAAVERVLREI